jgi:MFS family permease
MTSAAERLRDYPGFVRFWAASTVSGFGAYITSLAIQVLVVINLHEGAAGVGLVSSARWLPYPLFGLVVGVLVDRSRRRPLLVITDVARGLLLIAIPVLGLTHRLSLLTLILFMVVFGLMSLANDAASQSFISRLVPVGLLTPANARLDQSDAVAQTAGPALAGGLVSLVTAPWAVLVDAVSYLASGLLLLHLPVIEPASRRVSMRGIGAEAAEGLRWMYGHRTLRPLALSTHGWFLCSAVAGAILPPFVLRTLGLSPFGYGIVLALGGVGGLLGSLIATRLGARFGAGPVVISCRVTTALAWALIATSTDRWFGWIVFGVGEFIFGLSLGAENANEMGYWQTLTPDNLQGRVNATRRSVNRAMIVIGAPLGGLVGDAIGFRPVLWAVAAGFLIAATGLALTRFRGARVDQSTIEETED